MQAKSEFKLEFKSKFKLEGVLRAGYVRTLKQNLNWVHCPK